MFTVTKKSKKYIRKTKCSVALDYGTVSGDAITSLLVITRLHRKLDRNLSPKIVSKTDPVPTYPAYRWAAVHRLPSPKCRQTTTSFPGSSRTRLGKLFKVRPRLFKRWIALSDVWTTGARKIRNCFSCVPHRHKLLIKDEFHVVVLCQ